MTSESSAVLHKVKYYIIYSEWAGYVLSIMNAVGEKTTNVRKTIFHVTRSTNQIDLLFIIYYQHLYSIPRRILGILPSIY